jgi:hypothetical protein
VSCQIFSDFIHLRQAGFATRLHSSHHSIIWRKFLERFLHLVAGAYPGWKGFSGTLFMLPLIILKLIINSIKQILAAVNSPTADVIASKPRASEAIPVLEQEIASQSTLAMTC